MVLGMFSQSRLLLESLPTTLANEPPLVTVRENMCFQTADNFETLAANFADVGSRYVVGSHMGLQRTFRRETPPANLAENSAYMEVLRVEVN